MSATLIGPVAAPELHLMTLNVRRRIDGIPWPSADRWDRRRPRLDALLSAEQPSILGTQEVLPDQARAIGDALGAAYAVIGHGRHPGPRGEGCPIFYDRERLELLGAEQLALSDHPTVPGSVSWGNVIPRVYVRAAFRDRATGLGLTVVNTHLDVFSARARLRGADAIHRVVRDLRTPAVVLGDLNAAPASPPWQRLLADDVLQDAWAASESRLTPEWGTYGRYRAPRLGRRIDAILVTPEIRVRRVGINTARFADGWPSDHYPVHAALTLAEAAPGTDEEPL